MEIKGCPMFVTEAAYVNERVVDAASIGLTIYGNFTKWRIMFFKLLKVKILLIITFIFYLNEIK